MIVALDVLLFAVVVGEGGDSLRGVRGENGVVVGWMVDDFLFRRWFRT